MKRYSTALALMAVVGCGGISKVELEQAVGGLKADLKTATAELERKITDVDSKFGKVLAMEQTVKNGVDKIQANAALLDSANERMIQILTAQRNALKEQLSSVETQLEALQKK